MRFILTFGFLVAGTMAQADPGHLSALGGHDHWVAGAAIVLAILTGIWGAWKGKQDADDEAEAETEEEARA